MTSDTVQLSSTSLLAAATELFERGQFLTSEVKTDGTWPTKNARLFEDAFSIVAVIVYDTWTELSDKWIEAQTALVELMSAHIRSWEAKAWEGYLVLLTPALVDSGETLKPSQIRYDTHRVRKILATGDELKELADVERALLPVLPLDAGLSVDDMRSSLDLLPDLLSEHDIPQQLVRELVESYLRGRSLMQQIDDYQVHHANH